jgi:photosystem II stability/assembly factor-like uncharacterized protein
MAHIAHAAWTPIGPYGGNIHSIEISHTDGDLIWVMSNESPAKIAASIDGGNNWSTQSQLPQVIQSTSGKALTIDPSNHDIVYAASLRYVYTSPDGGINWTTDTLFAFLLYDIVVHPTNSDYIYACGVGFYFATDFYHMAFFQSSDAGETWTYMILDTLGSSSYGYDIAVARSNPDILSIAGVRPGDAPLIYKSTDGGASFTNSTNGIDSDVAIQCIEFNPSDENVIYCGTNNGKIYRSSDGGATWINNYSAPESIYKLSTSPLNSEIVFSGGTPFVYLSTDAGVSWMTCDSGLVASHYYGIAVDPLNYNTAYVGCSVGVYKTTDCGDSWFIYNNDLNLVTIGDFCVAPSLPSLIYVSTENFGVHKSTNYGTNWNIITTPLTCGNIGSLTVNPLNPDVILALEGYG